VLEFQNSPLGAQPLTPGWKQALIKPHTGSLSSASGKIPTPLGPITVAWNKTNGFQLEITLPDGMTAQIMLPTKMPNASILVNGQKAKASPSENWLLLDQEVNGTAKIELK
jgi:alpha-L-rhamnosidase